MHTDHTLPSDSIVTVDANDRRLDTYFVGEGGYKKKERKGRFGENNAQRVYIRLVSI